MASVRSLCKLLVWSLLFTASTFGDGLNVNNKGNEEINSKHSRLPPATREGKQSEKRLLDLKEASSPTPNVDNSVTPKNLDKVTIEVQRLFDSFNTKRNEVDDPLRTSENADEITVVIENDGNNDDDNNDDNDEGNIREERDNLQSPADQSGFAIILDNTNSANGIGLEGGQSADFAKLSHSYEKMNKRFQSFLKEEKLHMPTHKIIASASLGPSKAKPMLSTISSQTTTTTTDKRRANIARNKFEPTIEKLKNLRDKLKLKQEALRVEDDNNAEMDEPKRERSNIIGKNNNEAQSVKNDRKLKDETKLPFSNPSPRSVLQKPETKKIDNKFLESSTLTNTTGKPMERIISRFNDKMIGDKVQIEGKSDNRIEKEKKENATYYSKHNENISKLKNISEFDDKNMDTNIHFTELHRRPTLARSSKENTALQKDGDNRMMRTNSEQKKTDTSIIDHIVNNDSLSNVNRTGEKIVHPRKAQAMLEYLNKDPLESWIYKFVNLKELGLNSTMLRNGLVNAGSIDRLKNVMFRALKGEDITLSIVGGSISAGGGLYKDEESIAGLYYKGLADWWNKAITPLTGSEMKINNIAIGSIGTDYFSFCLKSHIVNESNIILWELSGNDYNRYLKQPTKGARPLERLTRMALLLPRNPALLYINFFKGVDYKKSKKTCPNFEDQGEDVVAHYYKIPSLSWRAMVCEPLIENKELFTLNALFCRDQYHPSLRAHAQTALLLILHLRHVMRSVLQWASSHDGYLPDFTQFYNIPPPLFLGLEFPTPLCWTLITPDFKESIYDSLEVKVLDQNGFKLEYATNFPIRFDRVICWKAEKVDAVMKIQFSVPDNLNTKDKTVNEDRNNKKVEVAITTHTRFGGSAEVWLDQRPDNPVLIKEGREHDTGKRTQVDMITKNLEPGVHTLNLKAVSQGFCLTSIMVD